MEHLTFKGIPIDGTLEDFKEKLVKIGYETINQSLKGRFANQDAEVFLPTTSKTGIVHQVIVVLNGSDNFPLLDAKYQNIVLLFTKKYGSCESENRYFETPYYEGDGYEIQAIRNNKCQITTRWKLAEGEIRIIIYNDCSILVGYTDEINNAIARLEEEELMYEDI